MLSLPKKTKYRKQQKGRSNRPPNSGGSSNLKNLQFGKYGIKGLEAGRIPGKIIEASRRVITRTFKRGGKIWIRVFPDLPVTSKPLEVRMGKGKGGVSFWGCRVKKGQILFEMDGVSSKLANQAALLVNKKLPISTLFVSLDLYGEKPCFQLRGERKVS